MANKLENVGGLGLHVIKYPSGLFGFVGRVPAVLAYRKTDGSVMSQKEYDEIAQFGPGSPSSMKARCIACRTWKTEEYAVEAANDLGFLVNNSKV